MGPDDEEGVQARVLSPVAGILSAEEEVVVSVEVLGVAKASQKRIQPIPQGETDDMHEQDDSFAFGVVVIDGRDMPWPAHSPTSFTMLAGNLSAGLHWVEVVAYSRASRALARDKRFFEIRPPRSPSSPRAFAEDNEDCCEALPGGAAFVAPEVMQGVSRRGGGEHAMSGAHTADEVGRVSNSADGHR